MESVKPPDAVSWTENVDCEWRMFKQRFMLYLQAVGLDSKPDAQKIALLLTVAGPQAVEVYNTFVYTDGEDKDKFDTVVQKFDEHCSPKKNETLERIQLKDDAQPVIHAPSRVPAPLRDKLKQELDRMTSLGVIKKVEEPTEWVNSMGFWQMKLHEDSTKYCTFNTPFGRYSFQRMPFGITSAPEVFHRTMEHILEGIEGVRVYIDDIVLWGSTLEQHNERLIKVLQRIQHYGLKLNRAKCQFGVKEIAFLGDKLSGAGVKPDRSKVKAILEMPQPKDKKGVLRVLGMINFIGKFIPNLSSKQCT
ncbi:hypothetical protein L3Q82_017850 [Scortum barcoo]|uniref:Uncharacterized protein n=1 Tax=Scortum barcoo TaxID=214431 RepID=A0ACB8VHR7_9TELE|nr:hypothetical protein L3Q82_017850 [Scortum barcoo]